MNEYKSKSKIPNDRHRQFPRGGDYCNCHDTRKSGKSEVPRGSQLKAVTATTTVVVVGVATVWPRGTRPGLGLGYIAGTIRGFPIAESDRSATTAAGPQ